ncbi:LacI family DNA-binding transcriptional regulator [Kineococcus sp. G2]|uniref:LacI family DNA-binding transcriptional regulator n=1 Tax=Kineococcus sp. G2 TaxID=3127484 RepID=UPI00301E5F5C
MPTSKDVARLAGVSQSTVSFVVNGRDGVAAETRARVEAAMAQLQYQPNAGARALKEQRTRALGIVMPFGLTVDRLGVLPFIETFTRRARQHDHDVLLVTADEGPAGLLRLSRQRLCDAIVLMDVVTEDARVPVAADLDLPVVVVGVPAERAGLPCVDLDYELAGRLAVEDLVATGHRRVRVLGDPLSLTSYEVGCIRRVQRGAAVAALEAGVDCAVVPLPAAGAARSSAAPSSALADVLAGLLAGVRDAESPLGLVVPSRQVLTGLLPALAARGLRPGRDVSVVAQCDDELAVSVDPPLTSVSLEGAAVAERAMDLVFAALDARAAGGVGGVDRLELVVPRLTRRRSTCVP